MRSCKRMAVASVFAAGLLVLWSCKGKSSGQQAAPNPPAEPTWTATRVAVVEKMNVPESVVVDPDTGMAYVSNVEGGPGLAWAADGKAFISRLKPGGELDALRWKDSSRQALLNAPKGLCIFKGNLYAADISRVVSFPLGTAPPSRPVTFPPGRRYNDMAADGEAVYVSDTAAGKVIRADEKGHRPVKAPQSVNGITFFKGRMFAVSWGLHEVYELDAKGKAEPKPFGLAKHFSSLDGIELLDDGTFIVSDYAANKVCTISPDRKTVRTLVKVETPADIGLDRKRGLLYVPEFEHQRVVVYKLQKK
jgi:DNA-binding beta-propeller fold protein YncE